MEEYLSQLNPSQREAVQTTEGYVRVISKYGFGSNPKD